MVNVFLLNRVVALFQLLLRFLCGSSLYSYDPRRDFIKPCIFGYTVSTLVFPFFFYIPHKTDKNNGGLGLERHLISQFVVL